MSLTTAIALHKDDTVIDLATNALHDITDASRWVLYATVLTEDGFELDGVPAHEDDRLGSMASSIQALSEAVARELAIGGTQYVIIAAEAGHVIQLRVPGHPLVLAAVFGTEEPLGNALTVIRLATARLMAALDRR